MEDNDIFEETEEKIIKRYLNVLKRRILYI